MTRILIADDNPQNLYLLETLLKGCGYEVTSAGNGVDALDLARKSPPDLIITDILMPGLDGFELCRQCKADEQLRHIPFIFYTAHYTDPKDEQFALSLGAERYITKPQQPELLVEIVREVLLKHAQGTIASPAEPPGEDKEMVEQYSEVLFRQLEKKVMELEHEIVERKRIESQLAERLREIEELKQRLENENVYLQAGSQAAGGTYGHRGAKRCDEEGPVPGGAGRPNRRYGSPPGGNRNRKRTAGPGHP